MLLNARLFSRTRRATVKSSPMAVSLRVCEAPPIRERKGHVALAKTPWRRCTTGTNHISAFGVWRVGSRRTLKRVNRTGETRWHRLPLAGCPVSFEKGKLS